MTETYVLLTTDAFKQVCDDFCISGKTYHDRSKEMNFVHKKDSRKIMGKPQKLKSKIEINLLNQFHNRVII